MVVTEVLYNRAETKTLFPRARPKAKAQPPEQTVLGPGPAEEQEGGRGKLQNFPFKQQNEIFQLKKPYTANKRLEMTLSTAIH